MSLATEASEGTNVLLVDVTKVQMRGLRVSLRGRLVLQNQAGKELVNQAGNKLMDTKFSLQDARSAEELQSLAAAAVREIERALAAPDNQPDPERESSRPDQQTP